MRCCRRLLVTDTCPGCSCLPLSHCTGDVEHDGRTASHHGSCEGCVRSPAESSMFDHMSLRCPVESPAADRSEVYLNGCARVCCLLGLVWSGEQRKESQLAPRWDCCSAAVGGASTAGEDEQGWWTSCEQPAVVFVSSSGYAGSRVRHLRSSTPYESSAPQPLMRIAL